MKINKIYNRSSINLAKEKDIAKELNEMNESHNTSQNIKEGRFDSSKKLSEAGGDFGGRSRNDRVKDERYDLRDSPDETEKNLLASLKAAMADGSYRTHDDSVIVKWWQEELNKHGTIASTEWLMKQLAKYTKMVDRESTKKDVSEGILGDILKFILPVDITRDKNRINFKDTNRGLLRSDNQKEKVFDQLAQLLNRQGFNAHSAQYTGSNGYTLHYLSFPDNNEADKAMKFIDSIKNSGFRVKQQDQKQDAKNPNVQRQTVAENDITSRRDTPNPMNDKIAHMMNKLYWERRRESGDDSETVDQLRDRVASALGYDSNDPIFRHAWTDEMDDAVLAGDFDPDEGSDDDYTDWSMRQGERGMEEGSDDQLVWKQTSMSLSAAKQKYGENNAKIEGKNRLGEPIVLVKVPLVSKEGVAEGLDKETLQRELIKINQQMKLNHPRYNDPNSPGHTDRYFDLKKKRDDILSQLKQGVAEGSTIDGVKQDPSSLRWKQTSMSYADAVQKYGEQNVKKEGKNRLGQDVIAVKVPLGEQGVAEAAKWRQGYRASGHPAGFKHKSGEVGPLGGTWDEVQNYGDQKKVPVQKHRDEIDPLANRDTAGISTTGKPLLPKNKQRNLKDMIKRSKQLGPVGKLPEGVSEGSPAQDKNIAVGDYVRTAAGIEGVVNHITPDGKKLTVWNRKRQADHRVDISKAEKILGIARRKMAKQGVAEAKQEREYKVYIQDADGSERLGNTITAKSEAHAKEIAKKQGLKNITSIELKQDVAKDSEKTIWVKPSSNHTLIVVKSSSPDIKAGEEYDEGDLNNYANKSGYTIKEQGVTESSEWERRHDEFVTVGDRTTPEQINKIVSALGVAVKQASGKRGFLNQVFGKQSNGDLARMAHVAETLAKNIQRNSNAKPGTDERKELGQHLVYAVSLLKRIKGGQGVAEGLSDPTRKVFFKVIKTQGTGMPSGYRRVKTMRPLEDGGFYIELSTPGYGMDYTRHNYKNFSLKDNQGKPITGQEANRIINGKQDVSEGLGTTPKITFAQQTPGSWTRIDILVDGDVKFQAVKTIGPGHWTIHDQDANNIGDGSNKTELKASVLDYLSKQGQKYEMMLRNGQVRKFVAKDDADAKRKAKGAAAQSLIKMNGDVPGKKIKINEQGVAEGSIKDAEQALARHGQYKVDHEQQYGPMSGADLHQHEVIRKQLLDKKRRAAKKQGVAEGYHNNIMHAWNSGMSDDELVRKFGQGAFNQLKRRYGDGAIPVPDLVGYKPKEPEDKKVRLHRGLEGPGKVLKSIIKQQDVKEGYILKKTNVSKYMEPGDPDEYTQDINIKDTDYEIINNKTGQVVGTASWTTNDYFGPGALKITMKNGATRWLDIWEREKGNPQSAFNRFVKDTKTSKKYKEQGVAEALSQGNYKVGLEDIGKRVAVNDKTGSKAGYVLVSIRYTPAGLQAEIFDRKHATTAYYMLTDISTDPNQTLGEQGVAEALSQGNYKVGLEDIGKRVAVNDKLDKLANKEKEVTEMNRRDFLGTLGQGIVAAAATATGVTSTPADARGNPDRANKIAAIRISLKKSGKSPERFGQEMGLNTSDIGPLDRSGSTMSKSTWSLIFSAQKDLDREKREMAIDQQYKEGKIMKKEKDSIIEGWDNQLKMLLSESMTITTTSGSAGMGDSISVSATDEDATKLSKILHNAGITVGIQSANDHTDSDGIAIDVEPMAQDEIMSTLTHDESSDSDMDFMKKVIGIRGAAHDEHDEHEHDDYSEEDSEHCSQCDSDPCECSDEEDDYSDDAIMIGEEDVEEGNEFSGARAAAIKAGEKTFQVDGKTYRVTGTKNEDKEMCSECGGLMEQDHVCEQEHEHLDEWANSPRGKSEDEQFKTELNFMTNLISGGLNGMKRDQTTLPHTAVKTELGDSMMDFRKLAGLR